jgi:hypothetical protein
MAPPPHAGHQKGLQGASPQARLRSPQGGDAQNAALFEVPIMRRVVRAALLGQDPGDLSSLVNPEAVAALERCAAI